MKVRTMVPLGGLGLALCLAFPATPQAAEGPGPVNLVRNGGFEEVQAGGEPAFWGQQSEGGAEGSVARAEGQAHSGKASVLVTHSNDKGYVHPNHEVTLPPGVYLYRVWARSDADLSFVMEVYDTRSWSVKGAPADLQVGGRMGRDFSLRRDTWQRCEMVVNVSAEFPASLQIGLRQRGRLWLDDVEVVATSPLLVLADTARSHPASLTPDELRQRPGWQIIRDRTTAFRGDAWLGNTYVGVAFRRGAPAAEYYATRPDGAWRKLSDLTPSGSGGDRAQAIQSYRIRENYPEKISLEVSYATVAGKTLTVRYRLQQDRRFVETEARPGTESLVVSAVAPFAVLPDWFGGDLVVNAAKTAAAQLRWPRERLLLNLVENGDAILVLAWRSPDQPVLASLAGEGEARALVSTEVGYRWDQRGNVWVGALTAPGIWRQKRIAELTDPKGNQVGGKLPFEAVWRVDFRRQPDGLIDPWVPVAKRPDGNWEGCRSNGSRTLWTSCRDDVICPAYYLDGSLYLVNTRFSNAMQHTFFKGADDLTFDPGDVALAYPFERSAGTPADVHLVNDLLQQVCEEAPEFQLYARQAPVSMPSHRYPATCAVTAEYEKAFEQGSAQTQRRRLLEELRRMDFFVLTKRERIEEYMNWTRAQHQWLLQQQAEKPELAALVARLDLFLTRMHETYTKGRGAYIKTTADGLALAERVEALIDAPVVKDGQDGAADTLAAAQELGKQTRSIGGAQDALVGYFRQIVKELRQTTGYAMLQASNESEYECACALRQKTMEMLWQTNGHEWR